jgi:nucleotide-binding universal stress UspA family protein
MYARVLIPLDGSETAEAILPFAERIAGPVDAEVCLLRVVEPVSAVPRLGTGEVGGPAALDARRLEATRYLAETAHRLECQGLRVRTLVTPGVPEREIVDVARREKADLIAMSTHGRRGLGRVVHGSVAEDVLGGAEVPVLLVRMAAPAPARPEVTRR